MEAPRQSEHGRETPEIQFNPRLRYEDEIVWLRGGPDDYPYLREVETTVTTRRGNLDLTCISHQATSKKPPFLA